MALLRFDLNQPLSQSIPGWADREPRRCDTVPRHRS